MEVEQTPGYVSHYSHLLFPTEKLLRCKEKIRERPVAHVLVHQKPVGCVEAITEKANETRSFLRSSGLHVSLPLPGPGLVKCSFAVAVLQTLRSTIILGLQGHNRVGIIFCPFKVGDHRNGVTGRCVRCLAALRCKIPLATGRLITGSHKV
ncbi:hypothetical protein CRG98_042346 [Punica granatum]|uniref:Uncharacterized protein n=1 Tax=Punica granatum TaxID=22663 RepID=A0A2I0HZW9_PUNGR|nr:hypothetical protein CRG98_042346 [Punica granatum]